MGRLAGVDKGKDAAMEMEEGEGGGKERKEKDKLLGGRRG